MALEKYVRDRFEIEAIDTKWSAQWYQSVDGLPYIGLSPTTSHIYMAIGFGGDGLTWGSIAAKINCDLILGLPNPYIDLFSPSRHEPMGGILDFVSANADVAMSLTSGWLHPDFQDVKDMIRSKAVKNVVQARNHWMFCKIPL